MRNENRLVVGCDVQAAAPADAVFPLLCPVREYDWIEGWQCEVVCSVSGSAENNCIFTTERSGEGRRVWVVSRYEPPKAIEFERSSPKKHRRFLSLLGISEHEIEAIRSLSLER